MKSSEEGFTLLEMIVALALMSLVIATVLPSVVGRHSDSVDAVANQIASVLRLAQARATSQNLAQTVLLDLDRHIVESGQHQLLMDINPDYGITVSFGRNGTAGGMPSYTFFADGQTTGGKIELLHNGERRVVAINWVTGAVTVAKP